MKADDVQHPEPRDGGPIARVLAPIRGRLIAAALLAAIGAMLTLVPLAGIAHLADLMLADATESDTAVASVLGGSLACLFGGMVLLSAGDLVAHLADNRITGHLRLTLTRRLARVPLGWFSARASGEVKQAMQDDIGTLHSLTAHFYTTLGRCSGAVAISLVYLFAMDWRMALISLSPFPLFFLFSARAHRASAANMQQFGAGMARINNAVVEFVSGIPVVKAFGVQGRLHTSYRDAIDDFARAFTDFTRPLVDAMANANAIMAPASVLGVVLAGAVVMVRAGAMAPVEVLPFVLVAPGLCAPLMLLSYLKHDLGSATAAAERLHGLLATPVLAEPAAGTSQQPADHTLRLEGVSYRYDDQTPVLNDLTVTLTPGTVTAIVGASGAGKSTLARLLLRFFDPSEDESPWAGWTCAISRAANSIAASASYCRRYDWCMPACTTTLPSAVPAPAARRSSMQRVWPISTTAFSPCLGAMTPWSVKTPTSPAVNCNGSASPAPCCSTRRCWYSTRPPPPPMPTTR